MSLASTLPVGQDYAFAYGRMATLRQLILAESDVYRLVGCHDMNELERILTELRLTSVIDQSITQAGLVLEALEHWLKAEVEDMVDSTQEKVFHIVWMENDGAQMAYAIKQKRGLTSNVSRKPQSTVYVIHPEDLQRLIETDEAGTLPPTLVTCVRGLLKADSLSPKEIDRAVAQSYCEMRLQLAKASGSADILRLVRHSIDAQNIRTALRIPHDEAKSIELYCFKGGTIDPRNLDSLEGIRSSIAQSDLHYHLLPALDHLEDRNVLESGLQKVFTEDIEDMWQKVLTVEAPFAFAATVFHQLRVLRAIVIGKRNGLSPQEIRQILPPFLGGSLFQH
ncbi:V-type ATPase subunit [Candidatus Peribacteria bacterium]|nr:V-type ATPase subunit [Candidatus Peribacteria bacterium]